MKGVTYLESLLLFHNDGHGKMIPVSDTSGDVFRGKYASRGLAVGDLNNDGYPDIVVGINGGPPLVLYNNAESRNHWIGVRLVGTQSNPAGTGAILRWSAGGVVRSRLKTAGGSFLSSHDPREILGLGKFDRADWIEIQWPKPGGHADRLTDLSADKYVTVIEGKGVQ
jgi:hypothetical protein